jgi:hypothetical protein
LTEEILPVESEARSPRVTSSSPVMQQPGSNVRMEAPGPSRMEVPGRNSGSLEAVRSSGEGRGSTSLERDIREAVGVGLGVEGEGESSVREGEFGTDT